MNVFIGASPHGQGEETTFAQIVADELGVDVNDVKVDPRRHRQHADGLGHLRQPHDRGRRRGAARRPSRKIKDKAKLLAGASARSRRRRTSTYEDGSFFVKGSPDRAQDDPGHRAHGQRRLEPAARAWRPASRRRASTIRRTSSIPSARTSPSSKSTARRARSKLKRYVAVDDCGPQINPVIVEGQVHGGVVQGIGQALWEGAVYDDSGQLLTGSLLDYALPRADVLPDIDVLSTVTPSPHHPLGVKGIGEAGTIASTAAVYNAVIDALEPFGVGSLTMPLTARARVARHARFEPAAGLKRGVLECSQHLSITYRAGSSRRRSSCCRTHPGAKLLAGGHSLIPLMKLRLATPPARRRHRPHRRAARDHRQRRNASASARSRRTPSSRHRPTFGTRCPMLADAAAQIGDAQVRNCGTIGGNVAHADPASDLPTVLSALGARFRGRRSERRSNDRG